MANLLRSLLFLVFPAVGAAVIFLAAQRIDLPFVWALFALLTVFFVSLMLTLDPGLRRERMRPAPGGRDAWMRPLMMPLVLAQWIVAGLSLNRDTHWGDEIPDWLRLIGLVITAAGLGLSYWSMVVNPFFSPVVRIQKERNHRVVTTGPYAFLRHPGYAGSCLVAVGGGLALGSWWAMVPLVPYLLLFLRRIVVEERLLRSDLPGYEDYARKVRYRVLPGVW